MIDFRRNLAKRYASEDWKYGFIQWLSRKSRTKFGAPRSGRVIIYAFVGDFEQFPSQARLGKKKSVVARFCCYRKRSLSPRKMCIVQVIGGRTYWKSPAV